MEQWRTSLATIILGLTITMVSSIAGVADDNNAQAPSLAGGSSGSASDTGTSHVMRRYVPQFVGKRHSAEVASSAEQSKDSDLDAIDTDIDFVDFLKNFENYDNEYDQTYVNSDDEENYDSLEDMGNLGRYSDNDSEESDSSGMMEDKRYVPSFVGKRDSLEEDKRYRPMFVGKRYRPMFVGKRYRPMFVGKRYRPMFVGKRYQPMFVGKRYRPMFVGKRYQPMFVGKRYQPMFVGKRYQPMFVGKRYQPMFVGKRYQPMFVGKRYQPMFVGKRYQPMFVGKRYQPMFVGKRGSDEEQDSSSTSMLDLSNEPLSLEKRSTEVESSQDTEEVKSRHKRSLDFADEYKRAWGRYVPWQEIPTIKVLRSEPPLTKRFVAPEFIGRRDSISSILTALKALKLTRSAPRLETKRFQAPMFVGKRDQEPNDDLLWSKYDDSALNDGFWEDLPLSQNFH